MDANLDFCTRKLSAIVERERKTFHDISSLKECIFTKLNLERESESETEYGEQHFRLKRRIRPYIERTSEVIISKTLNTQTTKNKKKKSE